MLPWIMVFLEKENENLNLVSAKAEVSDTHFKVPLMGGKIFRLHDIKEGHFLVCA